MKSYENMASGSNDNDLLERLCSIHELVVKVCEARRGVKPSFSMEHVIALLLMTYEGRVGRPTVAKVIGISDTSAKTLIRRLREFGVLVVDKRGCALDPTWRSKVKALLPCLSGRCVCVTMPLEVDVCTSLSSVLKLRDMLVKNDVDFEVIMCVNDSDVKLPGVPAEYHSMYLNACMECLGGYRGVCIVLSTEPSLLTISKVVYTCIEFMCKR